MKLFSFDTETHLIEPGVAAPKGVIASWCDGQELRMDRLLAAAPRIEAALRDDQCIVANSNIAFDFAVLLRDRPDLIDLVFEKYDRGLVWETFVAAALNAVSKGHLFAEPDGRPMRLRGADGKPFGDIKKRYSQELLAWQVLGIANAKANDEWKLRYAELEHVPFEQWPATAMQYPLDDARDAYNIALKQITDPLHGSNNGPIVRHKPGRQSATPYGWTHHTHNARAAFAMHLASVYGLRANLEDAQKLAVSIEQRIGSKVHALKYGGNVEVETDHGVEVVAINGGLLHGPPDPTLPKSKQKADGADNIPEIKRRVVMAYGGTGQSCKVCDGTGKITSPKSGAPVTCASYYQITENGAARWCTNHEAIKTCDGTGLLLPDTLPRSDGGGVSTSRDTLEESGDATLELLAEIGPYETIRDRFVPWLLEGARVPLNVRPNVLVDTARASYDGIIQTLPRKGGVRECVEPRRGRVFCSVDYNALELSTLAQCCLEIVGYSRLADSINAGKDQHVQLAAQMTGQTYADLLALVKAEDLQSIDYRQAAKAGNFGFGGLMGAAGFTLAQRKNGLRMCRLMGREPRGGCGSKKIYEWKKRPCPPLCEACVHASEDLRKAWLATWEEMTEYFRYAQTLPGMNEDSEEQPHGVITSAGTGYVRGGVTAPSAANHSFQHRAAYGAKHALWNVTRECYVDRNSPLYGSRVVLFLHDELILEVPEEVGHEAGYRLAEVMVGSMRVFVPDVRISAEPALMCRWYKGAKTVHDPITKRLAVWEPPQRKAA